MCGSLLRSESTELTPDRIQRLSYYPIRNGFLCTAIITAADDTLNMDSIPFPKEGFVLEKTDDREYVLSCMEEAVLASVDGVEKEMYDLWIRNTLRIVSFNMDDERNEAFVLRKDGKKIGLLWVGKLNDQFTCEFIGYILGIYVGKEYRGRGLGKALIQSAETWCREKGLTELSLNVGIPNINAKKLYEDCGFFPQSVVMRKHIRPDIHNE